MENTQKIENEQKPTESQIQDLIQNAIDKDYNKANQVFGEVMTVKLDDLLDQEKVKLAGQIYNGDPEDEDDGLPSDVEPETDDEEEVEGEAEGDTEAEETEEEDETEEAAADEEKEEDDEVTGAAV